MPFVHTLGIATLCVSIIGLLIVYAILKYQRLYLDRLSTIDDNNNNIFEAPTILQ